MDAGNYLRRLAQAAPSLSGNALRAGLAVAVSKLENTQIENIATAAGLCGGSIRRALKELEDAALLRRFRTGRGIFLELLTLTEPPTTTDPERAQTDTERAPMDQSGMMHHALCKPASAPLARAREPERAQNSLSERAPDAHSGKKAKKQSARKTTTQKPERAQNGLSERAPDAHSGEKNPPPKTPPNTKDKTSSSSSLVELHAQGGSAWAAAAEHVLEGEAMPWRNAPEQDDARLSVALKHPVADFMRAKNVREDDRRWLLARYPLGQLIADIHAAHFAPPRDGALGVIDVNAGRIIASVRESWGKWDLDIVRDALDEFGEPEKTQLATISSLETVAEARRLLEARGDAIKSKKGILRRIIESGEAAGSLMKRTRQAANRAAKKSEERTVQQIAANAVRIMPADEAEMVKVRELLAPLSDDALQSQWIEITAGLKDELSKRRLRNEHFSQANGHLRERILDSRVARQAVLAFLETHGS